MGADCTKMDVDHDDVQEGRAGHRHQGDKKQNGASTESAAPSPSPASYSPTFAQMPPPQPVGSKRTRGGGAGDASTNKGGFLRRSILRVGSRIDRSVTSSGNNTFSDGGGGGGVDSGVPQSPRARASTYSHVHDAVMYNLSNAEMSKHDQSVPMGVIGLKNLGNTCFLNSSLQCLSATIPLTDYFLGYDYRSEINKDNFLGTGGKLVVAYADLMKQMWLGTNSVVSPADFKQQIGTFAPQFSGYHQHDSQELLSFLLDGIHEDLNRVKQRPHVEDRDCDGTNDENDAVEAWKNYLRRNRSLVVDMFQGQLRNTCKCLKCGHVNIRFEPFMYLSLPMSKSCRSVDDCLDLYLQEDTLKGNDQYYCEKCKKHVDGTKKQDIWVLPPVLIIHLKRFKYNDYGKVGSKNEAPISYPTVGWNLRSRVKSSRGVQPLYDLYAVSNHMGGLGGGHYTAHALNRFDDTWYEFNDSSYRAVDDSVHGRLSKSAYVLFYNRSEGDISMPLNERSPMIRRQSVSRPDLWPHSQVEDPRQVRNFMRSSRRSFDPVMLNPPDLSSARREPFGSSSTSGPLTSSKVSSATDGGGKPLSSITEGAVKLPSTEFVPSTSQNLPDPPSGTYVESSKQSLPDPPSDRGINGDPKDVPKVRRSKRSTRPRNI
jgi:ubiquitin carboxyl-terminal hydrolase 8